MTWDGKTLGDIVKAELYNFCAYAISEVGGRSNSEYAALLKKRYNHSGRSGKTEGVYIDAKSEGIRLSFVIPPEELGDEHYIWLTWGMAARHIRAWEYEKANEGKSIKDEKESKPMGRKLQLDAAITKNMKAAASDSFIDNIKMIDIKEIIPSEKNFYEMSGIDLLADDIEREGLKHNLVVAKDPTTGLYEVKSGHRRLAAIELLIKEKRINGNIKIPCIVDGEKTEAENNFDLIMLNATQRKYSDADVMHEYEQTERTLKALADEGKPIKGRMRDNIAKILKVSPAQVGKIENIKHNAVPEVEKAVKGGSMSISTANELAKLPEEKQKEIIKEKPNISHAEVKEIQKQEKKPPVSKIAEDDDLDELDELLDDDDLDDKREVKPEKKSSLVYSLILSENEAKALLGLINDNIAYWDNDDELITIQSRLEGFVGE